MQTFLPYADFIDSMACLDYKRLGKQRVEAKQILNILCGINPLSRWRNHTAVLMWSGYEDALKEYANVCISEWIERGYNNNMEYYEWSGNLILPPWFGDERFHSSHRSNLLRKDNTYYGKFGWLEPDDLPYFWPTKEGY